MKDLTIGVAAAEKLAAGLVEDRKLAGKIHVWPEMDPDGSTPQGALHTMPMEAIVETMAELVAEVCREAGGKPTAVGIGFPGIVHEGIVEESPNLRQAKGAKLAAMLGAALESQQLPLPVFLYNDADVAAAGLAAIRGKRSDHDAIRVWTLGTGVGFGRYPAVEGVWEGGHTVVTLDPKEGYCGCGGKGHLEGIMGERAMRLRPGVRVRPVPVHAELVRGVLLQRRLQPGQHHGPVRQGRRDVREVHQHLQRHHGDVLLSGRGA